MLVKGFKILAVAFFMAFGFYGAAADAGTQATTRQAKAELKGANFSEVCMVTNNVVAGMPMIPVEVEGKTYFGCCQGCVGKLKMNPAIRVAKDPLTGKEVDKASAFIIADEKNKALYFESKETAEKYLASLKK